MRVLVLGAGQLARMMSLAGAPLNLSITAFDVESGKIVHPLTQAHIGDGLENALAQADVVTAEFEHIPQHVLEVCESSGKFLPGQDAILIGGDRRIEKALLDKAQVKSANYHVIKSKADFHSAIENVGLPMVLKTALGGYDGKGQWRLKDRNDAELIWHEMEACLADSKQAIVAEQFIPFDREVSLVGARNAKGEVAVYPLTENVHTDGVLSLSTPIDDSLLQDKARTMFTAVAETMNYVGVLAIEFFDLDGELLVNELAPRVHNSGHWTQQGAETCQFENHLRAVCGLPLGSTTLVRPTCMINVLGEDRLPDALLALEGCHIHWYGKQKRDGRKMGHINVSAEYSADLDRKLALLANILDKKAFPAMQRFSQE